MTRTVTDGVVVDHLTQRFSATCPLTGVTALLVYAGLLYLTVRVDDTLRPTVGWCTKVTRQTFAHWTTLGHVAFGVRPTGAGAAAVHGCRSGGDYNMQMLFSTSLCT